MVQFHSCIPIPVGCGTSINHVTFDGCDYFCTIRCKPKIIRFDPCSCALQKYCTCREYDCICYDYHDHCFWASSSECRGRLFKLDCFMNEIDYIQICEAAQYGVVTGLSYNCCNNTLIVSFPCTVIEIEKECGTSNIVYTTKEYWIMDMLCICPCILLTVIRCNKRYLIVINQQGEKIACLRMDSLSGPKNLIFNPCLPDCQQSPIQAFVLKKNCYPYLCSTDILFDDLGFVPACCNYDICKECGCNKPDSDGAPGQDVMESIALVETALSHILNAEGEKIQKVLAATDDIDKIIRVNKEVNKTILNATHLEHTLYSKLSALSDCGLYDSLDDPECDCNGHCCDK